MAHRGDTGHRFQIDVVVDVMVRAPAGQGRRHLREPRRRRTARGGDPPLADGAGACAGRIDAGAGRRRGMSPTCSPPGWERLAGVLLVWRKTTARRADPAPVMPGCGCAPSTGCCARPWRPWSRWWWWPTAPASARRPCQARVAAVHIVHESRLGHRQPARIIRRQCSIDSPLQRAISATPTSSGPVVFGLRREPW